MIYIFAPEPPFVTKKNVFKGDFVNFLTSGTFFMFCMLMLVSRHKTNVAPEKMLCPKRKLGLPITISQMLLLWLLVLGKVFLFAVYRMRCWFQDTRHHNVVVSNILLFSPLLGEMIQFDYYYFSNGLKLVSFVGGGPRLVAYFFVVDSTFSIAGRPMSSQYPGPVAKIQLWNISVTLQ